MSFFGRRIVCSFKNSMELKKRYPARQLIPDANCADDTFYFFSPKGPVRIVKMCLPKWTVWVCDHFAGFPAIVRRR